MPFMLPTSTTSTMATPSILLIISYKDGVFAPENLPGLPISSTSSIINNGMTGLIPADFLIALTDILRDPSLSGYSLETVWINFEDMYHVVLTRDQAPEAPSTPSPSSSSSSSSSVSSTTPSIIIPNGDAHETPNHTEQPTEWYTGEQSLLDFFEEEDEEEEQVNGPSNTPGWPTTTNTTPSTPWYTYALDGSARDSESESELAFDSAGEGLANSHTHSSRSSYNGWEFADSDEDVVVVAVDEGHTTKQQ